MAAAKFGAARYWRAHEHIVHSQGKLVAAHTDNTTNLN